MMQLFRCIKKQPKHLTHRMYCIPKVGKQPKKKPMCCVKDKVDI